MADKISQTRTIGQVQPMSRSGQKPPRQRPRHEVGKKQRDAERGRSQRDDGSTPRVDEYA